MKFERIGFSDLEMSSTQIVATMAAIVAVKHRDRKPLPTCSRITADLRSVPQFCYNHALLITMGCISSILDCGIRRESQTSRTTYSQNCHCVFSCFLKQKTKNTWKVETVFYFLFLKSTFCVLVFKIIVKKIYFQTSFFLIFLIFKNQKQFLKTLSK